MSSQAAGVQGKHEGKHDEGTFKVFVGIDWGTAQHAVDVGDAAGQLLAEQTVEHTSAGLTRFVDWLAQLAGGALGEVAVAIEVPRGALVELLLERGAAVFAVNPKQLDRFRDRFSVAGAKDDRLDARVLRSAVRTDRQHFRRVAVDEPLVIRVRELTRAADVLQQEFMGLTNRLRELVHRIAPEWLTLSPNADDPWFWMLVEYAATPTLGRRLNGRLGRGKIQRLLTSYRIRRVTPEDVLRVLEQPALPVARGTVEAVTGHIQLLLRRVRLVHEQRQLCERELEGVLAELATADVAHPPRGPRTPGPGGAATIAPAPASDPGDVAILQSSPGVGTLVTATFIAEARPLLTLRDYESLRAVTGVAPVRRQTGKNKRGTVSMRYACNGRLRNACYHWARVSTRVDAAARQYYADLRARGHSHGRALRSVADRWLRILIAMLKTRTLYDPTHFAKPAITVTPTSGLHPAGTM
jgi:transposase